VSDEPEQRSSAEPDHEAPSDRPEPSPAPKPPAPGLPPLTRAALAIGLVGALAITAVNLRLIARGAPDLSKPAAVTEVDAGDQASDAGAADGAPGEAAEAPIAEGAPDAGDDGEAPSDDEEPPPTKPPPKKVGTVREAVNAGCSTEMVNGLSLQIIAEARCLSADAFARVPRRKNLVVGSQVFFYLEAAAREPLLRALDAHPTQTMTVNSALRTIAQQYLLFKWGAGKRCGVQLAANPGESNHETGLALDVREAKTWRPWLEKNGFHWHGASDRVHFDYRGAGAVDHTGLDVKAFQRLWNRNHPDDLLAETGRFGGDTQSRLEKSPARGFAKGARCSRASETSHAASGGATKRSSSSKPAR
jgi:hypothetical protein